MLLTTSCTFAPSNPQGHFGEALMRKLAPLVEAREQANK